MNHHTQALNPIAPLDANALPRPAIVIRMLVLICTTVAAFAAVAFLLSLTTALPPNAAAATLALTAPTPPVWQDTATDSSVPAAGAVFAVRNGAFSLAQPEGPAEDEVAPTF